MNLTCKTETHSQKQKTNLGLPKEIVGGVSWERDKLGVWD